MPAILYQKPAPGEEKPSRSLPPTQNKQLVPWKELLRFEEIKAPEGKAGHHIPPRYPDHNLNL